MKQVMLCFQNSSSVFIRSHCPNNLSCNIILHLDCLLVKRKKFWILHTYLRNHKMSYIWMRSCCTWLHIALIHHGGSLTPRLAFTLFNESPDHVFGYCSNVKNPKWEIRSRFCALSASMWENKHSAFPAFIIQGRDNSKLLAFYAWQS